MTGSARLAGVEHDVVGARDRDLAQMRGNDVSMVFQEPMTALNPTMRVGAQVAETILTHAGRGGRPEAGRGPVRERVATLLDQVGLPSPAETARAYPHQLSGGQRQRVVLAIALANDPGLLVCDEPTTALDVTVQARVLDLIVRGVEARNSALLFITHDLSVVATVCERVLVMYGGRIVEAGPVSRSSPGRGTATPRGCSGRPTSRGADPLAPLETIPGSVPPAGCSPRVRLPHALRALGVRGAPAVERCRPRARVRLRAPRRSGPMSAAIVVRDVTRHYREPRTSLRHKGAAVEAVKGSASRWREGSASASSVSPGAASHLMRLIAASTGRRAARSSSRAWTSPDGASATSASCGRGCRSSSRTRWARSTPGCACVTSSRNRLWPKGTTTEMPGRHASTSSSRRSASRGRRRVASAVLRRPAPADLDRPGPGAAPLDPHRRRAGERARRVGACPGAQPHHRARQGARSDLVFVSHDLSVVRHICDRVAVMCAGEIVELGPTEQVCESPQDPPRKQLLRAAPSMRRALRGGGTAELVGGGS